MKCLHHMWVNDVIVTNRCRLRCSHCTQALTHLRKDQFYDMTLDHIAMTLDSLRVGFSGAVNCFGGEPTMHPQFRDVMALWREKIPAWRRASFSCGGPAYRRHKVEIDSTFPTFNYNDHHYPSYHQPVLVAGVDIIPDPATRRRLISRCWMQHMWGASVTPAGGYFCELAGTIDWLFFGGKHAYPLEPGWMRKTPRQFADQSSALCQYCGVPYGLRSYADNNHQEILSVTTAQLLSQMGSPAWRKSECVIINRTTYPQYRRQAGAEANEYAPVDGTHHWYRVHPLMRLRQKLVTLPYHMARRVLWPLADRLRGARVL
jgi:hypothetical protein